MINDEERLYPADPKDCFYYRTLFEIFRVYTTPKLKRVLEANNIKYYLDGKGKPFAHRDAVYGSSYGKSEDNASAAEAMDNMDTAISEFSTTITASTE